MKGMDKTCQVFYFLSDSLKTLNVVGATSENLYVQVQTLTPVFRPAHLGLKIEAV